MSGELRAGLGRLAGPAAAAAAVALLAAAAVPVLRRAGLRSGSRIEVMTDAELWLLCVFTAGALSVLLGLAAWGGWWPSPRGEREGGAPDGVAPDGAGSGRDAAGALGLTGLLLLAVYAAGWWTIGR